MAMAIPNGDSGDAASSKARRMPNDDFDADMMPDMHLSKKTTDKQTDTKTNWVGLEKNALDIIYIYDMYVLQANITLHVCATSEYKFTTLQVSPK